MISPLDIQAGKTYTCTFVLKDYPLDEFGRPGGMHSLADLPVVRVGDYNGEGFIVARDVDSELFEVLDHRTNKKWVVPFADASDITEEQDDA
jgi:hypothetical protein